MIGRQNQLRAAEIGAARLGVGFWKSSWTLAVT